MIKVADPVPHCHPFTDTPSEFSQREVSGDVSVTRGLPPPVGEISRKPVPGKPPLLLQRLCSQHDPTPVSSPPSHAAPAHQAGSAPPGLTVTPGHCHTPLWDVENSREARRHLPSGGGTGGSYKY